MNEELEKALCDADLVRAEVLLREGADINTYICGGSLLAWIISLWHESEVSERFDRLTVTRFMLDHGADLRLLDEDGGGPLFSAVIAREDEVLRLLLDRGADPNREHDSGETLYDHANFNYQYDEYDLNLPEDATDADNSSEKAWLAYLDRLAVKFGKRRPDHLYLLWERGALRYQEQQKAKSERA